MTEPQIIPEEVRRLRLEPGDRLIVRVSDKWTPRQLSEYHDYLQAHFEGNDVLVIVGEEIAVETSAPEPQWATAELSATALSDEDIDRIAARISRQLGARAGVRFEEC